MLPGLDDSLSPLEAYQAFTSPSDRPDTCHGENTLSAEHAVLVCYEGKRVMPKGQRGRAPGKELRRPHLVTKMLSLSLRRLPTGAPMLSWTNVPSALTLHGAHLGSGHHTWSSPTLDTDVGPLQEHLFLTGAVISSSVERNVFSDLVLVLRILKQDQWSLE